MSVEPGLGGQGYISESTKRIMKIKKYLVIGNPIEHSLSPKLHNHWIKKNNINAVYDKKQLNETDIEGIISEVKNGKIEPLPRKQNLEELTENLLICPVNEMIDKLSVYAETGID